MNGQTVVEHPIEWFIDRVGAPYWDRVILPFMKPAEKHEGFIDIIERGGYLGGGFLRRALRKKIHEHYKQTRKLFYPISSPFSYFFKSLTAETYIQKPDVDIWFHDRETWDTICKEEGVANRATKKDVKSLYNAVTTHRDDICVQLVHKQFGPPSEIIRNFDLVNAQIATDLKTVWMTQDFIDYELNNIKTIKINSDWSGFQPGKMMPLMWRVGKYMVEDGDYKNIIDHGSHLYGSAVENKTGKISNCYLNAMLFDLIVDLNLAWLSCQTLNDFRKVYECRQAGISYKIESFGADDPHDDIVF